MRRSQLVLLSVLVTAGAAGRADAQAVIVSATAPAGASSNEVVARLLSFDLNHDGKVETNELAERMRGVVARGDVDGDGALDGSEVHALATTLPPRTQVFEPQFRSVARGVTASYEAKALYTSEREHLATLLAEELRELLAPRGIAVEATPLRRIGLPQRLAQAIEEKLSAEQESQRMQFVLQKEQQEAERKRIEGAGIADFQRIVSQGISEQLLRWKGIEATLKIAESQNAKVVVVGSGKDGLPLILGGQ